MGFDCWNYTGHVCFTDIHGLCIPGRCTSTYGIYCCITGAVFCFFHQNTSGGSRTDFCNFTDGGNHCSFIIRGDLSRWAAIASLTAFAVFSFACWPIFQIKQLVNSSAKIFCLDRNRCSLSIAATQLPKLFGVESVGIIFLKASTLVYPFASDQLGNLVFGLTALLSCL